MSGHNGGIGGAAMVPAPLAKTVPAYDNAAAFEPRNISEALQLAKLLVQSRLLPKSVGTPEAAFAIIATGRELGMTAMQSLRSIHVIEGKPTLSADLVAALVKSRGDICKYFLLTQSTVTTATYETQRVGDPKPTTMSFTIEDAQRAGLTGKDNWRKYPAAMLRARCITALARAVYPDLAMGIYDEDQLGPVAVEEAQRWVPEPESRPAPPALDPATFTALAIRVDVAETPAELNLVAKDCMAARRKGLITDADVDQIAAGVKEKRAIIGAPKSDPAGVDDPSPEDGPQ